MFVLQGVYCEVEKSDEIDYAGTLSRRYHGLSPEIDTPDPANTTNSGNAPLSFDRRGEVQLKLLLICSCLLGALGDSIVRARDAGLSHVQCWRVMKRAAFTNVT